jgi:hypothetical protein
VFFADMGGNFCVLDSAIGQKLLGQVLGAVGRIGGRIPPPTPRTVSKKSQWLPALRWLRANQTRCRPGLSRARQRLGAVIRTIVRRRYELQDLDRIIDPVNKKGARNNG